ncbi:hypothetical protein GM1_005_01680 [Gordonia malaquae NBRC 108250]|uniref:Uncharacterized protein n=1 Tax=Gordonia malaquae NBRC 108250 TaxID=1223542 RepID=M3VE39_GORML|nr:hypothetical protein GM1_005_01680 [Gordonia malaquae NBRC 108250]
MRCQKPAYRSTRRFASSRLKRRSASRTRFTASTRFDEPDVADLTDSGVQSAEAAVDVSAADLERSSVQITATVDATARAPTPNAPPPESAVPNKRKNPAFVPQAGFLRLAEDRGFELSRA